MKRLPTDKILATSIAGALTTPVSAAAFVSCREENIYCFPISKERKSAGLHRGCGTPVTTSRIHPFTPSFISEF